MDFPYKNIEKKLLQFQIITGMHNNNRKGKNDRTSIFLVICNEMQHKYDGIRGKVFIFNWNNNDYYLMTF